MEVIRVTHNYQFYSIIQESGTSIESDANEAAVVEALSERFTEELKKAKKEHLECGEVLLPTDLTRNLGKDVYTMAEAEPCGLRGCIIYIDFEGPDFKRRLSVIPCDPSIAPTFELYITLKQTGIGWNNFLPQFLKKITKGGTVMISSEYGFQKNKLYRSYDD